MISINVKFANVSGERDKNIFKPKSQGHPSWAPFTRDMSMWLLGVMFADGVSGPCTSIPGCLPFSPAACVG